MKIKFERSYRKQGSGRTVFVYQVTGSTKDLKAYKASQGTNVREDDNGNPLFFTTNYAGKVCDLIITSAGKAVVDMSAFEQMSSLVSQFDGKFADAIAKQAVEQLLGTSANAPEPSAEPKAIKAKGDAKGLENL
jgi:hypothetical protein